MEAINSAFLYGSMMLIAIGVFGIIVSYQQKSLESEKRIRKASILPILGGIVWLITSLI